MQEQNYGAGNGVVLNVDFITTLSTQNVCFYNISAHITSPALKKVRGFNCSLEDFGSTQQQMDGNTLKMIRNNSTTS